FGITLYMQPVQDLTIDDVVSRTQYRFILQDSNSDELADYVPKLVERLKALPQLTDVATDLSAQGLAAYVEIDRDTAGRFGITPATIDNALYDAFGQRIVSTIFTNTNQRRVILQADPMLRQSLQTPDTIYLPRSTGGGQVPLSVVATVHEQMVPLQVNHLAQFPSNTVSFNLAPDVSLGEAVDAIKQAQQDLGQPPSIVTSFQGTALAFQSSLANE